MVRAQALIAVRMGEVRLIDNMRLEAIVSKPVHDEGEAAVAVAGPWIPF